MLDTSVVFLHDLKHMGSITTTTRTEASSELRSKQLSNLWTITPSMCMSVGPFASDYAHQGPNPGGLIDL